MDLYGEFDRPASDPVVGEPDSRGRSFLDIAREELVVEAEALTLLAER